MKIHVNFSSLRQIKWHEYLTRFAIGGAVSLAAGLIAHRFGAAIGGLFLAFPAIVPASATLLEKHEEEKKRRAGITGTIRGRLAAALDVRGAIMGTLALAAFALFVWKLLPLHNAALILAGGLLVWLALATTLWRLRKLHLFRTAARHRK